MSIQVINDINKFKITACGELEKVSNTISKCRVRIFYKGLNRNSTFISDEFAEKLEKTLPYTPIKGIFEETVQDYTDHGDNNDEGRMYGIVPAEPNSAWEKHLDEDGVEREYLCCDVYLYTAIYKEANSILNKSQSMELFKDTLVGKWVEVNQEQYYYFMEGEFLGLQVLGDMTEPCFEGSAFYSLNKNDEISFYTQIFEKQEGKQLNFSRLNMSDREKFDLLFNLLNPSFDANTLEGWENDIVDIYEDYALCYNASTKSYVRAYYTKENDSLVLGEVVSTYIVDINDAEIQALNSIRNAGSTIAGCVQECEEYKKREEEEKQSKCALETEFEECKGVNSELSSQIQVLNETVNSLNESLNSLKVEQEKSTSEYVEQISALETEKQNFSEQIEKLQADNSELSSFKRNIENQKKEEILQKFEESFSDSEIANYKEKISTFSVEDFEKEVCLAAYKKNASIIQPQNTGLYYKPSSEHTKHSGVIGMLEKYKNGGIN